MPKMIATKSMTYATRRLSAGDPFTARSRADAGVLVALGKARRGDDEPTAPKKVRAAPKVKPKAKPTAPKKPRAAKKSA